MRSKYFAPTASSSFNAPSPAFFNLRVDKFGFGFVHHQVAGLSRWTVIHPGQEAELQRVMYDIHSKSSILRPIDDATTKAMRPMTYYCRQIFMPPDLLIHERIRYEHVDVVAGQALVGWGHMMRCGFNTNMGETLSQSCNVMDLGWLRRDVTAVGGAISHTYGADFIKNHCEWVQSLTVLKIPDVLARYNYTTVDLMTAIDACPLKSACIILHAIEYEIDRRDDSDDAFDKYIACSWIRTAAGRADVLMNIRAAIVALHKIDQAFLKKYYVDVSAGRTICDRWCHFDHDRRGVATTLHKQRGERDTMVDLLNCATSKFANGAFIVELRGVTHDGTSGAKGEGESLAFTYNGSPKYLILERLVAMSDDANMIVADVEERSNDAYTIVHNDDPNTRCVIFDDYLNDTSFVADAVPRLCLIALKEIRQGDTLSINHKDPMFLITK